VLGAHHIGGLYATGGDIAVEVTKALGAEGFEINTELPPLAVAGRLSGGHQRRADRRARRHRRFSGVRVATPPARGEASVVTVACLEHLNHVLATGRKNP
jgi:D-threonate/D-erythronate kinase